MNELIINGQSCDLGSMTNVAITKQANDIGELQNRQGNFTNTFKLPLTQRNIGIFGLATDVQSNSALPYQKLNATYRQNGIEIIGNGVGFVDSVDEFINVSVTAGNASLSGAIGDLTIGDLYGTETIDWTLSNIIDGGLFWLFPLIDWRIDDDTYFDTDTVNPEFMLPCISVNDIFNRLGALIGFDFQGTYMDSSDHLSMYVTPSDFERLSALEVNKATFENDGFAQQQQYVIETAGAYVVNPLTDTFTSAEFTQGTIPQFTPSVNKNGTLKCVATISTFRTSPYWADAQRTLYFKYFIVNHTDSVVLTYYQTLEVTSRVNVGDIQQFVVDIETPEMTFEATKSYRVYFVAYAQNAQIEPELLMVFIRDFEFSFNQTKSILYGSQIPIKDCFRWKIKDLLKDVLNMSCLMVQTDDYSKIVTLDYLNQIRQNTPLDWTNKLAGKVNEVSFSFGKYARNNWFRYKENTNVPNNIADVSFTIDDDNLTAESDVVKFSHPATEQSTKYNGTNIPKIKAIDANGQWQKPESRLLQVVNQNLDFSVTYDDGVTTDTTAENIPLASFIPMSVLLQNYDTLQAMLDRCKVVKLAFKLTEIDVQGVNFMRPIYVEGFGLFYLNKIDGYTGNVTICELIRL